MSVLVVVEEAAAHGECIFAAFIGGKSRIWIITISNVFIEVDYAGIYVRDAVSVGQLASASLLLSDSLLLGGLTFLLALFGF